MEFGFFEDLSETDQAYIREILACKTAACKEGKKPQFAWINSVNSVETFDQVGGATCLTEKEEENTSSGGFPDKVSHDASNVCHELPAQMVPVPASVVPGMVSQPTYTMGFGMSPAFINYTAGVPIIPHYNVAHNPGMMSVFVPQVNYVPAVPVSLPGEQQTPQMTIQQAEAPVSHRTASDIGNSGETKKDAALNVLEKISQKPQERRNKKKRPADYYEKLAKHLENGEETTSESSSTANINQSSNAEKSGDMHTRTSNNVIRSSLSQERTNVAQVSSCNVSADNTSHHQSYAVSGTSTVVTATAAGQNAESEVSSRQISHIINTSPPPHSSSSADAPVVDTVTDSTSSVVTPIDSQTKIVGEHISQPSSFNIKDTSDPNSSSTTSQIVSQSRSDDDDDDSNASEGFPPLSETVRVQQESTAAEETPKGSSEHGTDISSKSDTESMQEASAIEVDKQMEPEDIQQTGHTTKDESGTKVEQGASGPTPQRKPNTWAGLFSGTKEAQNATVIYTAKEKEKEVEKVTEKKPEEKIPVVVAVTEDKLARDIADRLQNHRLNHKAISLQPRGLKNRRNWCYVSAALQALLACPPFYHMMKALPKREGENAGNSSTPVLDCLYRFVNEFSYLPHRSIEQNKVLNAKGTVKLDIPQGASFEPTYVYDVLKTSKYSSAFMDGRQEDAEEFFSSFINGLHDEMVACCKLLSPASDNEGAVNGVLGHEPCAREVEEEEDGWEQVGPRNKAIVTRTTSSPSSPISHLFQGQIRSILQPIGVRESATLQPFFTLQLDIQSDKVLTVRDALEGLVKKESLQDYTCSKTKQEVEATRRMTLEELPPVLVLHLKYFLYDKNGGCQKLNKNIEFGVDLEISKDVLSPNMKSKLSLSQRKYKLFGVVNHHGNRAVGGHYTTYVYHPGMNGWIHIDDEIIRSVPLAQVLKHSPPKVPYLLYYRRMDHVQL